MPKLHYTIEPVEAEVFKGSWKDAFQIPFDLLRAIFWLTPKAIFEELRGKHHDHHEHDEPIDDSPGWVSLGEGWPEGLMRQYFEAGDVFDDPGLSTIDGYQFRLPTAFSEMEALYFSGKSLLPHPLGFVGQIISHKHEEEGAPFIFVDVVEQKIHQVLALSDLAHCHIHKDSLVVESPNRKWVIRLGTKPT
ncbi:MAG: hypothetical protein AB8F95_21560 [Bacteroidia bacterium]